MIHGKSVSIGGLVVRSEKLMAAAAVNVKVQNPLLATLCMTYILQSSHISYIYLIILVDPDMIY